MKALKKIRTKENGAHKKMHTSYNGFEWRLSSVMAVTRPVDDYNVNVSP
jgi:hypothetical protein